MMIEPYYQDNLCTIYNADCQDVLPQLGHVELMLTDPPYGLEIGQQNCQRCKSGYGGSLGKGAYANNTDTYEEFVSIIVPRLNAAIESANRAIVFSGPHIHEQKKPNTIGGIYHPAATGRTPWGSKNFLPILFYGLPPTLIGTHRPTVIQSSANAERNSHPCPKPLEWIKWLLSAYALPGDIILDPFMGSGTTLRAAKDFGMRSIGIETQKSYCDIAIKRLRQESLFGVKETA